MRKFIISLIALTALFALYMAGSVESSEGTRRDAVHKTMTESPDGATRALYYPPSVTEDASEARIEIGYIRN